MSLSTGVAGLHEPLGNLGFISQLLGGDTLARPVAVPAGQPGVDTFPAYSPISDYTSLNQNVDMSGDGMLQLDAIWFRPTGLQLFTVEASTDELREWSMSSAFDLSSLTFVQVVSLDSLLFASSMQFSPDGMNLYIVDESTGLQAYTLSTPWDITTLSAVIRFNITNMSDQARACTVASDGSRIVSGNGDSTLFFEYTMSSAFDATTLANGNTQAQSEATTVLSCRLHGDGTKLYMLERGVGTIHEYDITDFDITTRVLADTGIDMETPAGFSNADDFQFNPDGSEVFIKEDAAAGLGLAGYVVP